MLFNSFTFFLFFPLVVGIYYLLPHRFRWVVLLLGSYFFYGYWKVEYLALIVLSTLVDYFVALRMGAIEEKKKRIPWLIVSLGVNLGVLFTFKYLFFFSNVAADLFAGIESPTLQLLLPVGISYYTFQTLSYSIDVYRGELKPERRLGHFALYVSFFPQLVAGPIERAGDLLPQFDREAKFEYGQVRDGLKQMLWGLFKKMVVADTLGRFVDPIFDNPENYPGPLLVAGAIVFALQIYYDFSGYCHIAVGAAQVLGIRLSDNFNLPYQSLDLQEIWSRWNISISRWFRDYVYLPLGGNRVSKPRWVFNVFAVFLLSGFWHGANWTFMVWGGLHGVFYLVAVLLKGGQKRANRWLKPLRMLGTFLLFTLAFVFFRASSIGKAGQLLAGMGRDWGTSFSDPVWSTLLRQWNEDTQIFGVGVVGIVVISLLNHLWIRKEAIRSLFSSRSALFQWLFFLLLAVALVLFGNLHQKPFIYFQF